MTREEAINEIKSWDFLEGKEIEAIHTLIPELKESEDERIRKFLIDYFTSYKIGNVATKLNGYRIDDILAYLEKQKEQKPVEWSEEDEDMLNSCISSIEEAKENRYAYKETDGDTSYDHEIAWLKSLRPVSKESLQPHWKPSEEQMKALEHFIRSWGESGTMSPQNTILCAANSLLTDLQKLL